MNRDTEDAEKAHFSVGSGIDALMTNPDSFNEEFIVAGNVKRPSGLMALFVEALPFDFTMLTPIEQELAYNAAYLKSGYKSSKEAVIAKYLDSEDAQNYYYARVKANGKKLLTEKDLEEIQTAVDAIGRNPVALSYFKAFNKDPDVEIIHQFPVYFEMEGVLCKGLLDGIRINHKHKTIEPFDLKSYGKDVTSFDLYSYGYHRQFAFYVYGLEEEIENNPAYKSIYGYKLIRDFTAIVTPKKADGLPAIVYKINSQVLSQAMHGSLNLKSTKDLGLYELLRCYNYHVSTGDYSAPYWLKERNFTMHIND